MLSQTLTAKVGAHAALIYLRNSVVCATTARALGLVEQLEVGVDQTQTRAQEIARLAVSSSLSTAICSQRAPIDVAVLTKEALGHAECQLSNGVLRER